MQLHLEHDMSVISEISSCTCKLDVKDFFPSADVITEIRAQDYIEDALQDGYGFWLEGEAKYYFHKWRSAPKDRAGKLYYLEMTQLYLERLIDDVKRHDIPQCRP
jgi:hypothetical protein